MLSDRDNKGFIVDKQEVAQYSDIIKWKLQKNFKKVDEEIKEAEADEAGTEPEEKSRPLLSVANLEDLLRYKGLTDDG